MRLPGPVTRIEPYSDKYYLDVVTLVQNFHKEAVSEYDANFEAQALIDTIQTFNGENANNAFLLIVNENCEGLLAGMEYKSMLNNQRIFQEIIWYVNEPYRRYGVHLLRNAEECLKLRGVGTMIMAVLENSKTEKIKKFYENVGYRPMEVHYVRTL